MSVAEIKMQCGSLSAEEKLLLLFFLKHSLRVDTASNQSELGRLHREMEAGERISLAQIKAVHEAMVREGM
jgi:hypothetical protein